LPELPGGPVKFSLGFERRNESTFDNPDSVQVNGDAQSDAKPTVGSYNVASGYFEFAAPILKDMPFAKALIVTGSVRYDYYNIFGSATTWKANVDYAPVEDIRFRVTRSTGLRAPSIKELFGGAFQNFPTTTDPCSAGQSLAGSPNCVRDLTRAGHDPATFKSAQTQIATINGGNPALKPESAQTWDVGTIITPRWFPGLSFTVDYWNVYIRNQIIDGVGTSQILDQCYDPAQALQASCDLITRQAGSGEIVSVFATNLNFGFEHTQGIDADLSYTFNVEEIGIDRQGSVTLTGSTQYLMHDEVYNAPGTVPFDQAGTWQTIGGSSFGEPRWKALATVNYSEDNWSASLTERYTGGVTQLNGTPGDPGNNAPGVFYTDLAATYSYGPATIIVGIDNLLDKDPPWLNDAATNSLPNGGYDYVGRFLYLKTSVKF
jgi:outer membrane receptor protein involved in Fe transport